MLLRPLVDSGALFEVRSQPIGFIPVPRWYGNDCLVFTMLVLPQTDDRAREAFSPNLAVSPQAPLAMSDPAGGRTAGACLRLAELLEPAAERPIAQRYDRYLHGHRVTAALLFPVLGPIGLQMSVLYMLLGLLGTLFILAALRALRRYRQGNGRWRRDAGFGAVALCFLFFYGFQIYGYWVSHAMSDLVLVVFLFLMFLLPGEEGAGPAWLVGAFGCFVSLFEFLTGGLPLGAGLVLLVAALAARPRGAFRSLTAFLAGAGLPFFLKIAVALLVFPEAAGTENSGQFMHRLNGPVLPELPPPLIPLLSSPGFDLRRLDEDVILRIRFTAYRFWEYAWVNGLGSEWLGRASLYVGLGGTLVAGGVLLARDPRRSAAIFGAAGVLVAWYLIFLNHSLLHPFWMVRCTVIFLMAFLVSLVLLAPGPRWVVGVALPGSAGCRQGIGAE